MADLLFPIFNPNDAPAISAVLALLLAGEEPPRVDVTRVHSKWLDRDPYTGGRLWIRGACRAGPGQITGHHVWYTCARYGRAIPVREENITTGEVTFYDAPFDEFSCVANPPHDLNSLGDGWREAYDAALATLT